MSANRKSQSVTAEEILDQAQIYASTWSSVGGPFDDGHTLDRANQEKAELQRLVERLAFERDHYRGSIQNLAKVMEPGKEITIGIKESQYPENLQDAKEA